MDVVHGIGRGFTGRGADLTGSLSTIFTLHGVAPDVDPRKFAYRNISDERVLTAVLSRRKRFVPLLDSLAGKGDALTIDDATRASADAALLARRFGHAVTLFVNPGQVDEPIPYSFLLLGVLCDRIRKARVTLDGVRYPARSFSDRDAIRRHLKEKLREMPAECDRIALMESLAAEWGGLALTLPDFLQTLNTDELRELRDAGVDIQNHGWSHVCHRDLSANESQQEIDMGRRWLAEKLGVVSDVFAVPFGDVMPRPEVECRFWLTVDYRKPAGRIAPRVWNRDTLEAEPEPGAMDRMRNGTRKVIRLAKQSFPFRARTGRPGGSR